MPIRDKKIAPIVAYSIHVKNSTNSSIPDSRFIQVPGSNREKIAPIVAYNIHVHATCSRIK